MKWNKHIDLVKKRVLKESDHLFCHAYIKESFSNILTEDVEKLPIQNIRC